MAARRGSILLLLVGLVMASLPIGIAGASDTGYVDSRRMYWAPTYGYVATYEPLNCTLNTYCHEVDEMFTWEDWPSMVRLDSPRTPANWGTYEHELRFYDRTSSRPAWCDYYGTSAYSNAYWDLPTGWYEDTLGRDVGEFAFGMPGWRIIEDYYYDVGFNCSPSRDQFGGTYPTSATYTQPSTGVHNLKGQIGHCHTSSGCNTWNVYSDTTNAFLVRLQLTAPDFETFSHSFDAPQQSLEDVYSSLYDPKVAGGSAVRVCNGTAYHDACQWNARPTSSTTNVRLYLDGQVDPNTVHDVNDALNEWHVRCPASQNASNCSLYLYIQGLNSSNTVLGTYSGSWFTVPRGTAWYWMAIRSDADDDSYFFDFPTGTVKWRFVVYAAAGQYFDADFHNARIQA